MHNRLPRMRWMLLTLGALASVTVVGAVTGQTALALSALTGLMLVGILWLVALLTRDVQQSLRAYQSHSKKLSSIHEAVQDHHGLRTQLENSHARYADLERQLSDLAEQLDELRIDANTLLASNRVIRNSLGQATDAVRDRLQETSDAVAGVHQSLDQLHTASTLGTDTLNQSVGAVAAHVADLGSIPEQLERLTTRLPAVADQLYGRHRAQLSGEIGALRKELLADQQALEQLTIRYQLDGATPPVSDWESRPEALLWLVDRAEHTRPGSILECGSGMSTFWLAMSLRANASGRLLSLSHDEDTASWLNALLSDYGLEEYAEVRWAPLSEVGTPRGPFQWYAINSAAIKDIDLLVVNGPPNHLGRNARYPALPVLADQVGAHTDVVVMNTDDLHVAETIEFWLGEDEHLRRVGRGPADIQLLTVSTSH